MFVSEVMKKVSWCFPVLVVLLGIVFLFSSQKIGGAIGLSPTYVLLVLFAFLNGAVAWQAKLVGPALKTYSLSKIHHFILGVLIGTTILVPIIPYFLLGEISLISPVEFNWIPSLWGTLCIVAWEELWFRGVPLQYAAEKYSKLGSCILFGLLFAGMHVFNPSMNLISDGLYLFTAGYSLGLLFFITGSMWAPIGAHFSNNFLALILTKGVLGFKWEPSEVESISIDIIVAISLTMIYLKRKNVQKSKLK